MTKLKVGTKKISNYVDVWVLVCVLILSGIGIYSMFSITYNWEDYSTFNKHLTYVFWGWVLMLSIAFVPERWIRSMSFPFYFFTVIALLFVLLWGVEINGTKGWFRFAGFSLQPAEFSKLAVLLATGSLLSIEGVYVKNVRGFGLLLAVFLIPTALTALQPDFGTSVVVFGILWGILYWADFNLNILVLLLAIPILTLFYLKGWAEFAIALLLVAVGLLYINRLKIVPVLVSLAIAIAIPLGSKDIINHLSPHQQTRIQAFIDPGFEPEKGGYNLIQSLLAVGSGGVFGKGILSGTQTQLRYVYAQSSDFVFSVPAEEFGFIGASSIILVFTILIIRLIKIGLRSNSLFFRYIVLGYATLLSVHFVQNIGMVIGLLPVMGIPLPFLSSGGSFFIVNSFLVGIALNAYRKSQLKQ